MPPAPNSSEVLRHVHIFGLKGDVRSNIHFLEEGTVMYPCGNNIAVYHTDTREQELIPGTLPSPGINPEAITALATSPNRRLIAVAERCDTHGVVNIYDAGTLRRRKLMSYSELGSKEFVHMSFSADSKLCLTLGGAPDYSLVLWAIEKAVKVVAVVKLAAPNAAAVYRADFCPADPSVVCVTGDGVLRFFRIIEGAFKPITLSIKREPQNYVCHCWLPEDRVVVATDNGELMIIENFEFKCVLPSSPNDGKLIGSLLSYSKGFIVGGAAGVMRIYERSEDSREFFKLAKTFSIKNNPSTIMNLTVSPSEDILLCSTQNHQLYTFSLSNTDILKEDGMNFELLMAPFHSPGLSGSATITGLDTCIWKPLVVSCGLDRTVRVWNYQEKTLDLVKTFDEEAHSVALHPSGLYVLVGFTDRLRLCSILMDDIRVVRELNIKSCRECRFSNGGQHFAVVNNTTIQVYNTYTCELTATLRGHNGKVRSIYWKTGDRNLCSVGLDGAVFVWNVGQGAKDQEQVSPRSSFSCGAGTPDFSRGYVVGTDLTLKEYDLMTMTLRTEIPVDAPIGECVLSGSNKLLFCGTSSPNRPGVIKVYKVTTQIQQQQVVEYSCHAGPVTCMRLSYDNMTLFTGSEDGSLCIFSVNDAEYKGVQRARDRESAADFAEEILVTKGDLEEKSGHIQHLHNKVEELSLNNEYQLRLKDMNYKEKIKEISDKFTNELEADRSRYESLLDEKREMETEYEDRLKGLEHRHAAEFKELEQSYNSKINTEVQRYEQLTSEREEQNRKWDEENQILVDSHTEFLQELTDEYDKKVESEQLQQNSLAVEKDQLLKKFESTKELVEEDAELEVEDLKQKFEGKLAAERKATLRLRGENGFMKKKYDAMIKDVNDQKEEINSLHEKEKELHEAIKGLEKDIQGHKKEIREREETIVDKEKRIYDLKKKNQELEKFKFVLDYKIKELKRQIEPRENEIADMRTQIEEMDLELEQYHKSNSALDLMIGELRLKMDGMNKEIQSQNKMIDVGNEFITRFRRDLHAAALKIGDNKGLKDATMLLYKQYAQDDVTARARAAEHGSGGGDGNANGEIQTEYNRQREHLERSVEALKRNIVKDVELHATDHARLIRENVSLTKEINELRREFKDIALQDRNIELTFNGGGSRGASASAPFQLPGTAGSQGLPMPPSSGASRRSKPPSVGAARASSASSTGTGNMDSIVKELDLQQLTISQLEERIMQLRAMVDGGNNGSFGVSGAKMEMAGKA